MTSAIPLPARLPHQIGVFGHRGASQDRPENTLAAFALALEQGAEGIELDVALSSDGVPVVMHDSRVDRTTDGTADVASLTLEQLRTLNAGGGEPVPTLAEVLALAEGRAEVNIEIKAADAARPVLEVVSRFDDLAWFASSFHWSALEEVRRLAPSARIYPLTFGAGTIDDMRAIVIASGVYSAEDMSVELERFWGSVKSLDDAVAFAEQVDAAGLSIWDTRLGAEHVERLHSAGLEVWVWTVNDPSRIAELLRMGIDAICTDVPATAVTIRADLPA
jgi:glycerophosphoryl diester phosphodiesterase